MAHVFKKGKIEVTDFDSKRLKSLIVTASAPNSRINNWLYKLGLLLEKAKVVSSDRIKSDIVTMNSRIKLKDKSGKEEIQISLVFPVTSIKELTPDFEEYHVSVLSPVGLSVLGRQIGDVIGECIIIAEMLYQPEAEGDYHL